MDDDGTGDAALEPWPHAMLSGAGGALGGIFSLSFYDDPPDGLYVSAVAYMDTLEDACSVFEEDSYLEASSPRSHWVALLHLSDAKPGTFGVTWQDQHGGSTAQVIFKKVVKGVEEERHTALSGQVTVSEVPGSLDEWHEGTVLRLAATVELSTMEDKDRGCTVGGSDGSSAVTVSCVCEKEGGETYSCEGRINAPSCCLHSDALRETLTFEFKADQCAARCEAGGLRYMRYCQDL